MQVLEKKRKKKKTKITGTVQVTIRVHSVFFLTDAEIATTEKYNSTHRLYFHELNCRAQICPAPSSGCTSLFSEQHQNHIVVLDFQSCLQACLHFSPSNILFRKKGVEY